MTARLPTSRPSSKVSTLYSSSESRQTFACLRMFLKANVSGGGQQTPPDKRRPNCPADLTNGNRPTFGRSAASSTRSIRTPSGTPTTTVLAIYRPSSSDLPYLKSLGIHAVWQSPVFPSPIADFGYDVFDYTGLDPISIGTSGAMARSDSGPPNNWLFEFGGSLATRRGSWTILLSRFSSPSRRPSDLKSQLTNCRSSAT